MLLSIHSSRGHKDYLQGKMEACKEPQRSLNGFHLHGYPALPWPSETASKITMELKPWSHEQDKRNRGRGALAARPATLPQPGRNCRDWTGGVFPLGTPPSPLTLPVLCLFLFFLFLWEWRDGSVEIISLLSPYVPLLAPNVC